jgi:transcription initiation factor TFIID subunit 15
MGQIPSTANMPSSKFIFPKNFDILKANQSFTIQMAVKNLETGNFANPDKNYFSAPQQVNANGTVAGHSHFVIQEVANYTDTIPLDPQKFAFFSAVNTPANNGVVSVNCTTGLPVGIYRMASINTATNHQPVLVPIAQHGSLDDMVYVSRSLIFDNIG